MKDKQLFNYLKKSFLTGSFKTVIVALSTIVLLPLIIQQIGIEKYGIISLTMIFGGMVVFADFGIAKSVTLLIGQDEKKLHVNAIFSNSLVVNISILILIGTVLTILVYLDLPILGEKFEISKSLKNYIVLIGFILLSIMLINNLLCAILESFYLMHYVNIGFALSSILLNLFIYLVSLITESIFILLLAPLTSFLLIFIYFSFIIKRHTKLKLTKPDLKQIKKLLSISYKFLNIGLVNSLIIPANKYLLVYLTGSSAALGLFDIGLKIAMIANSFLNSIAQPLFGVFSNLKNNQKEIYKIAIKTSGFLLLLYFIGNILFYFLGENITRFIDENNQYELYKIGLILLLGIPFSSVSEPFYRGLIGTERLKEALYLKLLVPVFNISFFYLLTKTNILESFAKSYSLAIFLSSFFIILYYIQNYKIKTSKWQD